MATVTKCAVHDCDEEATHQKTWNSVIYKLCEQHYHMVFTITAVMEKIQNE